MSNLYTSGFTPRGVRKAWERTSMEPKSTQRMLGEWALRAGGTLTEAVAWFEGDADSGALRVLVADFNSGKRLTLRKNARGSSLKLERLA